MASLKMKAKLGVLACEPKTFYKYVPDSPFGTMVVVVGLSSAADDLKERLKEVISEIVHVRASDPEAIKKLIDLTDRREAIMDAIKEVKGMYSTVEGKDDIEYVVDLSRCSNCFKGASSVKLMRCGLCRQVSYCGKACQTKHWKAFHKDECSGKRVTLGHGFFFEPHSNTFIKAVGGVSPEMEVAWNSLTIFAQDVIKNGRAAREKKAIIDAFEEAVLNIRKV